MASRGVKTTHWGVASSMGRALPPHILQEVIDQMTSDTTHAEFIARLLVLAEVHDRSILRPSLVKKLDDACRQVRGLDRFDADRWPRFVARSLQETSLHEIIAFVKQISIHQIAPADNFAYRAARPIEVECVDDEIQVPDPYVLKVRPRALYLKELLGEKTAETVIGSSPTASSRVMMPTPGAGTSRRLSRHRPTAKSSAPASFNDGGLVPLGRGRQPNGSMVFRRPITPAAAKFHAIRKKHEKPKTQYVDENEAKTLLPPPDTLRARQEREEERKKKKQEEQERRKARAEEARRRDLEKKRKIRERKLEATRRYKNERKHYYGSDEDEDMAKRNEVEVIDLVGSDDDSLYSPGIESKRASSRTSMDNNTPPSKRVRVPRRSDTLPNARTARTGQDAYLARGRISNKTARISEMEANLRPPQYSQNNSSSMLDQHSTSTPTNYNVTSKYGSHVASPMRPPPVFEPNGLNSPTSNGVTPMVVERKTEFTNVTFPKQFTDAVGEHRQNLNDEQIREILQFTSEDNNAITALFPSGVDRKEYVLNEFDHYSLVLRLLRNGTWQRVRYTNV